MATDRSCWKSERMFRVPSVAVADCGPGLSWMSPERMMRRSAAVFSTMLEVQ